MKQDKEIKFEDIKLHLNNPKFVIKTSLVHGVGLFTCTELNEGEDLGPILFHKSLHEKYKFFLMSAYNGKLDAEFIQTTATRYINHSKNPNTEIYLLEEFPGIIYLRVIKAINDGDEITLNYVKCYEIVGVKSMPDFLYS